MSFLNWFFGKKALVALPDRIWLTSEAACAGFLAELGARLASDRLIFVLAYFPDRLAELEQLLVGAGLKYRPLSGPIESRDASREFGRSGRAEILVGLAELLVPTEQVADSPDASTHISVLVRERHLLRGHDERIENFAAGLPYAVDVQFVLSLEDAMMKQCCGDWVTSTLRRLGMDESEALESNMVARRIKAAQRKTEWSCTERIRPARSAADWLTNNIFQH